MSNKRDEMNYEFLFTQAYATPEAVIVLLSQIKSMGAVADQPIGKDCARLLGIPASTTWFQLGKKAVAWADQKWGPAAIEKAREVVALELTAPVSKVVN